MQENSKIKIRKFIEMRHKNQSDFMLTDDILFSKLAFTKPFINGIDAIHPYKVIFYIETKDNMYTQGFRQGMLFDNRYS